MKAVILAAGKGTRMGDLSLETPKPMLKVLGKTLLEHKLDAMPDAIDEVVLVVGHLKEKIVDAIGNHYRRLKITYVNLDEILGTAYALSVCKDLLANENKFLVMMGDDIYCKEDMEECLACPWSILIREKDSLLGKGKVVFGSEGKITDIIEKYPNDEAGFVCAGMYALTPEIFKYEMVQIPGGEYGLPQTILSAINDFVIHAAESRFWLQITKPEDLKVAEEHLNIKK